MSNPLIEPASVRLISIENVLPEAPDRTALDFAVSLNNPRAAKLFGGVAWAAGMIGLLETGPRSVTIIPRSPSSR